MTCARTGPTDDVCVCVRERERESECVCVCARARARVHACVFVRAGATDDVRLGKPAPCVRAH